MLFFLTGDIQIGKTRWLERQVDLLEERGVRSCGVIAPGVWIASSGPRADSNGLEKTGINNMLLPERKVVPFAVRRDIAVSEGVLDENSQSEKSKMGWHIDDRAIDAVNRHFEDIRDTVDFEHDDPGLLVIDELGHLELAKNLGLVKAMELLETGPSHAFPHAIAVVREDLFPVARDRFEDAWGRVEALRSTDEDSQKVLSLFSH